MFLKCIELFGFKSFADRSKIELSDGISALLGPNGCGKSNVVDCIKWVLGEQSTRTLRADKMEDIIFNGTENRKALNVAEVIITFENDKGILPIDVPEISVKRRLHRSGESEYFINNTPVRLREVRELFFDTGIGKTAYSVMEQGKIDQVLSNKPEERRYLFEEAAGITKYKIKGAEAERKLEKTEENMRQVEGILGEVKRSYDTLKRQSEKTFTYRDLKEKIFSLELDLQLLKLKDLLADKAKKDDEAKERIEKRDLLKKKIDDINLSLEENLDMVNTMESKLIENQKKLYSLDMEKHGKENRIAILRERSGELNRQVEAEKSREAAIREKMASLKASVGEKERDFSQMSQQIGEVEKNITAFEKSIHGAGERIRENEHSAARKEQEIRNLDKDAEETQNHLRSITDEIVGLLDKGLKETGYSLHARAEAEQFLLNGLESLEIHLKGKSAIIKDALDTERFGEKETPETFRMLLAAFEDVRNRVELLGEGFSKFRALLPAFIDDFIAPEGIITRKREIDEKISSIRGDTLLKKEESVKLREENRALTLKIDEYRKTLEDLRVNRARMNTRKNALGEMMKSLSRDIQEQDQHLQVSARNRSISVERIKEIKKEISVIDGEKAELERKEKTLRSELKELETGIAGKNKDLMKKEGSLKDEMQLLGKTQSLVEKVQMELASITTEIKNIYDNFNDRHSRDLSEFDSRIFEITITAKETRETLNQAREELRALGQVNLMAPEEYAEVKERYDFLKNQLDDLYKAREDLRRITRQIRTESSELFLETYDQIKRNFHSMFRRLFGGGRGELRLTEPDDVLTSGIEIFAQPPGKKLENIALLSGGERSLTAVGLLFATYMVKPSPFCILDEIDAALDEANVARFVGLLNEFGQKSQFVIITHNKKTVAAANTLLGITMEESGVSKIISVRLEEKVPVADGVT